MASYAESEPTTAMAVADDLELRDGPLRPDDLARYLHELIDTAPEFHSVSVVTMTTGSPAIFESTAAATADTALEVGRPAIDRRSADTRRDRTPLPCARP